MMFNIDGMNYLVRLDLLGSNLDTVMCINQKLQDQGSRNRIKQVFPDVLFIFLFF